MILRDTVLSPGVIYRWGTSLTKFGVLATAFVTPLTKKRDKEKTEELSHVARVCREWKNVERGERKYRLSISSGKV